MPAHVDQAELALEVLFREPLAVVDPGELKRAADEHPSDALGRHLLLPLLQHLGLLRPEVDEQAGPRRDEEGERDEVVGGTGARDARCIGGGGG